MDTSFVGPRGITESQGGRCDGLPPVGKKPAERGWNGPDGATVRGPSALATLLPHAHPGVKRTQPEASGHVGSPDSGALLIEEVPWPRHLIRLSDVVADTYVAR